MVSFKYAVLAGLYTDRDSTGELPWSDLHQYRTALSFDGISGSGRYMPVSSMSEFEKINRISINVYGYEEDVFPVHITSRYISERHINLRLLSANRNNEETEIENFDTITDHRSAHYYVMKDMSRLGREETVFLCMRCLSHKDSLVTLREHERICSQEQDVRCVMPGEKEQWLKFRNWGRTMKVSFVIVASFACYTSPLLSNDEPDTGFEVRERSFDCCAYSYVRISIDDTHPKEPVYYRGSDPDDTMAHFLSAMAEEEAEVFQITSQTVPPIWCDEGIANIAASNDVCNDTFLPGKRVAVDRNHERKTKRKMPCRLM